MKCSEINHELSLYADGMTADGMAEAIRAHLDICPLCRQKNADYLLIRADLRSLIRPEISLAFKQDLKRSLRSEISPAASSNTNISEWLQMWVMPYTVGVVTSVVVGFGLLIIMLSGMLMPTSREMVRDARTQPVMIAQSLSPDEYRSIVSPADFVNSRLAFASESPSINPEGALMALTRSMVRGGMKDEEVVVVADVFSDGLATIAEVVESPSDRRAVDELERAFRSGQSAFVPAVMENRPDNMRIVLKLFQSVDVETNVKPTSRRRS
jgi:hypothetical protein